MASTKPSAIDAISSWSACGFEAGQEMAKRELLSHKEWNLTFTLDYLAAIQTVWLRQAGIKRLSGDRQSAFAQSFRLGFARAILACTGFHSFNVALGDKRIRLLPSPANPTWTVVYLDGALDQQTVGGVLDPFEAIRTLQSQDWPAQRVLVEAR